MRRTGSVPSAAAVLRRALLVWGLGHLALGDRRGWLLVVLQPLALAALFAVAVQLVDGTRWLIVFPPLATLILVWIGQAVHAYRRAVSRGAEPGGALQIALLLPLAVAVLTAYWLFGGRHGSPSATLEAYIEAWIGERPAAASSLFVQPPADAQMAAEWDMHSRLLRERIEHAALEFGPSSGLDPERPFDSLRFSESNLDDPDRLDRVAVSVDIVRSESVETMILGIVPTAGQETVVVERAMVIWLSEERQPSPEWLPILRLESFAWKISEVAPAGTTP